MSFMDEHEFGRHLTQSGQHGLRLTPLGVAWVADKILGNAVGGEVSQKMEEETGESASQADASDRGLDPGTPPAQGEIHETGTQTSPRETTSSVGVQVSAPTVQREDRGVGSGDVFEEDSAKSPAPQGDGEFHALLLKKEANELEMQGLWQRKMDALRGLL